MGVRSRRSKKRRRAAAVSIDGVDSHSDGDDNHNDGGGGGVDLISFLNDDLLVRILDLVPDAEAVVRTHALSRRWRGLWTGVASLRFDFNSLWKSCRSAAAAERYIAFVNGVLALRAAPAAKERGLLEDLVISFNMFGHETKQFSLLSLETMEAAQRWIRYAAQHGVKSLILKLELPWRRIAERLDDEDIELPVVTLDEMDNYVKLETMHLSLGGATLRLPSSTAVFSSLTDLSLEHIKIQGGDGYLFSRIMSSVCCPRLQKLHLWLLDFEISTMEMTLRIEADTLLELSLRYVYNLRFLELRTPSLQVLHISNSSSLDGFTVSAPRLENLMLLVQQSLHIDDVHGHLSNVGTLKIQLFSHGHINLNEDLNDGSIHLLQRCRLTRCLDVHFEVPKIKDQTVDVIKGRIPLLPHVTHIALHITLLERHSTGPFVACLLAQCGNIKYLSLQLQYLVETRNISAIDLLCDNNSCLWKSHEFSLAHLQEVEFKELIGTDCEFQFIQYILANATGIQKVTISFDSLHRGGGRKHAFKLLPPLDGGLWTTCKDSMLSCKYKWRRCL